MKKLVKMMLLVSGVISMLGGCGQKSVSESPEESSMTSVVNEANPETSEQGAVHETIIKIDEENTPIGESAGTELDEESVTVIAEAVRQYVSGMYYSYVDTGVSYDIAFGDLAVHNNVAYSSDTVFSVDLRGVESPTAEDVYIVTADIYLGTKQQNRSLLDRIAFRFFDNENCCVRYYESVDAVNVEPYTAEFSLIPEAEYFALDEQAVEDAQWMEQNLNDNVLLCYGIANSGTLRYGCGTLYYGVPLCFISQEEEFVTLYRVNVKNTAMDYSPALADVQRYIAFGKTVPDEYGAMNMGVMYMKHGASFDYICALRVYSDVMSEENGIHLATESGNWVYDIYVKALYHAVKE